MKTSLRGVLSPVVTPFNADYTVNAARLLRQCQWLQQNQVGLALFGTNSEGNSLSVSERISLLDAMVVGGIDPACMMPGTGACSTSDAVQLSTTAVKLGCAGVLVLPPFFYKGVADEGLFRYYAELIERVGDARLQVYLYHIPPIAQIGISLGLIERLRKAYPRTIAGIKDSSDKWDNTKAFLDECAGDDFDVFVASESYLLDTMRNGGAGCISATTNINPAAIYRLYKEWQQDDAVEQQRDLDVIRSIFKKYPMIAALKTAVAHWSDVADWSVVRPPLVELDVAQRASLMAELNACKFSMTGL